MTTLFVLIFQAVIASLLDSYNLVILGVFLLPNLTLVESLLVLAATSSTSHSLRLVISSCKEAGDSPTVFSESTLASIIQLSTCVCLFISSYHSQNSKYASPFRCHLHLTDSMKYSSLLLGCIADFFLLHLRDVFHCSHPFIQCSNKIPGPCTLGAEILIIKGLIYLCYSGFPPLQHI